MTLVNNQPSTWNINPEGDQGDDIKINNWGGTGTVTIDWISYTLTVETDNIFDGIVLVGRPTAWDPSNATMLLDNTGNQVYKNTFKLGANEFNFRFLSEAGNWDSTNYGSDGNVTSGSDNVGITFSGNNYSGGLSDATKRNWLVENWTPGTVEIAVDVPNSTVTFTKTEELENVIYVIGDINGWNIDSTPYRLYPTETPGVYAGTINFPGGSDSYFCFYGILGNWDTNAYGAKVDSTAVNINSGADTQVEWAYGKNSFYIPASFSGGDVTITFDTTSDNNPITFSTSEDAIVTPPLPSQLRLVGVMNGWDTYNSDYILTADENNEGIYSATFSNFPKEVNGNNAFEFKALVGNTWGIEYGGDSFNLMGNVVYEGEISTSNSNNIKCANWEGGEVTITVDLSNTPGTISIAAPEQPTAYPETMYLIGNFNNWKLADSNYAMNAISNGVFKYSGEFPLLDGELNFKIINGVDSWESPDLMDFGGENFALYCDKPYSGILQAGSSENIYCYNWQGGQIEMNIDLNTNSITITGPDQPKEGAAPSSLFLTGIMTNWKLTDRSYELELQDDGIYEGTFELDAQYTTDYTSAPEFKIFYEASWSTVFGAQGDETVMVDFTNSNLVSSPMVLNGQNWQLANWAGGEVKFTVNWNTKTLTLEYLNDDEENTQTTVDIVFESTEGSETIPMALEIGSETVYYGILNVSSGLSTFNIVVTDKDGVTVYGPGSEIIITDETEELSGNLVEGESVWTLDCEEAIIGVTIDLENLTYSLDVSSSAIKGLEIFNGSEVIYNLQGVKVDRNKMIPGIYVVNGKKVLVK